jgi:protocatechuate 3,4-dioxygenase beta subunit
MTRRDCLLECVALGSLRLLPGLALADSVLAFETKERHSALKPTPPNALGPFYKRAAPNNAHLRGASDPGLPLSVSGHVLNTRGETLPAAKVEIWHADHLGKYDLDGYRYRASLSADATGQYAFDSVMPGHYPGRVCQHVHYVVTGSQATDYAAVLRDGPGFRGQSGSHLHA